MGKVISDSQSIKNVLTTALFLIVVPAVSHLLFSWMGYVPGDQGFILAYSRRILEGQIPHRDFISIRPVFSYIFHSPVILFGGDYTFWIARLVAWFEFACIAWAWTIIFEKLLKRNFGNVGRICFSFISFALSVHNYPVIPFYSTDGIFFISIGLLLCLKASPAKRFFGYLLMGTAYLCKQNYLPVVFIAVVVLGDWRKMRFWIAATLPAIVYLGSLLLLGAAPDIFYQLFSQKSLLHPGLIRYIFTRSTWGGILWGAIAAALLSGAVKLKALARKEALQRILGSFMLYLTSFIAVATLGLGRRMISLSFVLFGSIIGILFYLIIKGDRGFDYLKAGILVLLTAWCSSISVGYPQPILMSGPMAVFLLVYSTSMYQQDGLRKVPMVFIGILALFAVFNFTIARFNYSIYGIAPFKSNYPLAGVVKGARLIKVEKSYYEFLADFNTAIERTGGRRYTHVTDLTCHWVRSKEINPLPIDWTHNEEILTERLFKRVVDSLDSMRGDTIIIVQKERFEISKGRLLPITYHLNKVEKYVIDNYTKIDETRFFELYK